MKSEVKRVKFNLNFLFSEITPSTVTACTTAWWELAGTLCRPAWTAVELSLLTTGRVPMTWLMCLTWPTLGLTWTRLSPAPAPLRLTAVLGVRWCSPPGWRPTLYWWASSVPAWWLSRSWESVWPAVWPGRSRSTTSHYNQKIFITSVTFT